MAVVEQVPHAFEKTKKSFDLSNARVLIVDDEPSIRESLKSALEDEGCQVDLAASADEALDQLLRYQPSLVFLDIWMPGRDGLQTLTEIKERYPDLAVVVMSGHANISIAVKATQSGAIDFLEKPLDLNKVLSLIEKVSSRADIDNSQTQIAENSAKQNYTLNPIVFESQSWACGKLVPQCTLARPVTIMGQGLHSGVKSGLMLEPLPENSGIHFVGIESKDVVPAHVNFVESTGYATTLRLGGTQVGTIEHLMSALSAFGITNLLIKCTGEIPVLDGSAQEFCQLLKNAGVVEQQASLACIKVDRPIRVEAKSGAEYKEAEYIEALPSDKFIINYTLDYPEPLGQQNLQFQLDDLETYQREIAPARTFSFVKDVSWLQSQGLAQGGRFNNFVLFADSGPINTELRFSDEPVRHKILDAIGDLYLLGRPLQARINARMTGHSDNIALLKAFLKELSAV